MSRPKEAFVVAQCRLPVGFDGVVGVYATDEFKPALLKTEKLPGVSIRLCTAAQPLIGRLVDCDGASHELSPLFSTRVDDFIGFRVLNQAAEEVNFVLTLRGRSARLGGNITNYTVRGSLP